MNSFLKVDNGQILYDGAKMELFVPDEYFKSNLAEEVGTGYRIFGYCRAYHYTVKDDSRDKAIKSVLCYPLTMQTFPSSTTKETINFNGKEEKYWVFTYYKEDVVFQSNEIIQDGNTVQAFYGMLMNGKLDIVEYKHIPRTLQICKLLNGVSFDVPALYEEVTVADYYRNPDDPSKPARFEAATTTKSPFYARGVTQREKVSYTSTFAGLTFEDITQMLTKADNNKRDGKEEYITQVEKNALDLA